MNLIMNSFLVNYGLGFIERVSMVICYRKLPCIACLSPGCVSLSD